jgi:hypothetical protein
VSPIRKTLKNSPGLCAKFPITQTTISATKTSPSAETTLRGTRPRRAASGEASVRGWLLMVFAGGNAGGGPEPSPWRVLLDPG